MIYSQADCVTLQEQEFATILDSLSISYQREPHIFLLHKENQAKTRLGVGMVPDFWLPDYNIHLELTTSKQSSVCANKKRRKARRILEAMPYAQIRVLAHEDMLELENLLEDANQATTYLTKNSSQHMNLPERIMPHDINQIVEKWNAAKHASDHTLVRKMENDLIMTGWHLTKQNGQTLVRPVFHPDVEN